MKRIKFVSGARLALFGPMFPIVIFLIFEFVSCNPSERNFYGEIPVGFKPEMRWEKPGTNYEPIFEIAILLQKNGEIDTVKAIFNPHALQGGFMVMYRDSYPPTKEQPVFVRGYYEDGQPHIAEAYSQKPEDYH